MKQMLRNLAWWPGFGREVEELCRSCDLCQSSDRVLSQRARPAPMQPVELPERAWSKLGMDIVGPINEAPANARFAITLIDYRSKWVEIGLTSSVETEDVIKFLSPIWARKGYPDEITTDNGPQFTSKEFTSYLVCPRREARQVIRLLASRKLHHRALQQDLQVVDHWTSAGVFHRRDPQEAGSVPGCSPHDHWEVAVRAPARASDEAEPACHSAFNETGRCWAGVSCSTPTAVQ